MVNPKADPQIRALRAADAEAVAVMQSLPGFYRNTLRLPYAGVEEIRRWIEAPLDGKALVAVVDGQVVGMIDVRRFPNRRAHVGGVGMGVHDDWVGRGIGTRLMTEIIGFADRWLGLRRLELTVYTDNTAAIALYRRFGFEVEGTHRAYALRDGVLVDALAMARVIMAPRVVEG